jgi:hypothetical protein
VSTNESWHVAQYKIKIEKKKSLKINWKIKINKTLKNKNKVFKPSLVDTCQSLLVKTEVPKIKFLNHV